MQSPALKWWSRLWGLYEAFRLITRQISGHSVKPMRVQVDQSLPFSVFSVLMLLFSSVFSSFHIHCFAFVDVTVFFWFYTFFVLFVFRKGIVIALRVHGKTNAIVAGGGFLCIVNLTYLNAECLAANGRLFGDAGACSGQCP